MALPSITCPGCTCLCDDIQLVNAGSSAVSVKHACDQGSAWFAQRLARVGNPVRHRIDGEPCTLPAAIEAARQIIKTASAPLIGGLENLSVDAQQQAWKLADAARATIDTSLNTHGRASMYSLQKHGKVTATLGEIATRGDLVVFWFCDPATTHPRLLDRLATDRKQVIVIDDSQTVTADAADQFIHLRRGDAAATLKTITAFVNDRPPESLDPPGAKRETIGQLADDLRESKYGSICYGHTTHESQFDLATDQIARLVRTLNGYTRFVALPLRNDGNAHGAENVIAWSSGYPFAVSYANGMPQFNRNEHAASTVLARAECDVVLVGPVEPQKIQTLPTGANRHLQRTPTIELSTSGASLTNAKILIHVAEPGIDDVGDFCRLDNTLIPLTKIAASDRPNAAEVLRAISTDL